MTDPTTGSRILIIDYGSQFTQLIARRVREARVYSEIHPPTVTLEWVRMWNPTGIILSGGPNSVYDEGAPTAPREILDVAPVLGVCYGMNLIVQLEGGRITPTQEREYGRADSTDCNRPRVRRQPGHDSVGEHQGFSSPAADPVAAGAQRPEHAAGATGGQRRGRGGQI